jgi:hypothetical protein
MPEALEPVQAAKAAQPHVVAIASPPGNLLNHLEAAL